MPAISKIQLDHFRRSMRDVMAVDPLISIDGMRLALEKKYNKSFDWRFVKKLVYKVHEEIKVRLSVEEIGIRIGLDREEYRIARENMLRIAFGEAAPGEPKPSYTERIAAWRAIAILRRLTVVNELSFRGLPDMAEIGSIKKDDLSEADIQALEAAKVYKTWDFAPPGSPEIEPEQAKVLETPKVPPPALPEPVAPIVTEPKPIQQGQKIVIPKLHGGFQVQQQ